MKTFVNQAAQGDVLFIRVAALPANAVRVPMKDGWVFVSHSEKGHHHVMDGNLVTMYRLPEQIYECFLVVTQPDELRHLGVDTPDTHESILFAPGTYKVRRQREYVPEGFRRVED